jgi:hypothetical protein
LFFVDTEQSEQMFALFGLFAGKRPVPIASHAERPLPDARRTVSVISLRVRASSGRREWMDHTFSTTS